VVVAVVGRPGMKLSSMQVLHPAVSQVRSGQVRSSNGSLGQRRAEQGHLPLSRCQNLDAASNKEQGDHLHWQSHLHPPQTRACFIQHTLARHLEIPPSAHTTYTYCLTLTMLSTTAR